MGSRRIFLYVLVRIRGDSEREERAGEGVCCRSGVGSGEGVRVLGFGEGECNGCFVGESFSTMGATRLGLLQIQTICIV